MTTIQSIPEEILLTIFSNLSGQDLIQCQYVCRSWFIPGRVKFLNRKVILTNTTKNKRFSAAINRNPNPRFLAAVREVETSYTNASHVNNSVFNNILFRFPNLESVAIGESLVHKFDDDVCEKFLLCCPKLSELRICTPLSFVYLEELENVRLLLTELDLQSEEIDDIEQFVASFPRLKSLHTYSQLDTFESLLPVLAQSSSLKSIKFKQFQNGPDHFLEKYLQSKTQDEQTQLLERISQIKNLDINCTVFLSESVINFISKYMTGLDSITIESGIPDDPRLDYRMFLENTTIDSALQNDLQQTLIDNNMLNMIRSIKRTRTITNFPVHAFWVCLPRFIHEVMQHPTKEKTLEI